MNFPDLPTSQQRALIDLVSSGYLFRVSEGWRSGARVRPIYHSNRVMRALRHHGLCLINVDGGWAEIGSAVPSRAGRQLIESFLAEANAQLAGRTRP